MVVGLAVLDGLVGELQLIGEIITRVFRYECRAELLEAQNAVGDIVLIARKGGKDDFLAFLGVCGVF